MATSFNAADVAITTSRTLLYTCPGATQAVVFAGTVSNVDGTNKADHVVTLEVQKTDNSYVSILKEVPITYGGALSLPKIALLTGEKIYLTADSNSTLITRVSIVEKT